MRNVELTVPKLGLIAGTRAMLGAGIGLLVAPRLSNPQRRAVGWTLLLVGLVTTIPLLAEVFGSREPREGAPKRERDARAEAPASRLPVH